MAVSIYHTASDVYGSAYGAGQQDQASDAESGMCKMSLGWSMPFDAAICDGGAVTSQLLCSW
jgi:hypothetical protein